MQSGIRDGTLVKTGDGTLRLAGGVNSGLAVTLNVGTLAAAADTALGTGTFTLAGGTLVSDGGNRTIANSVSLTGNSTIGASLDGTPRAMTFTGQTTLTTSATLTISNDALTTFGAVALGANSLALAGNGNTTIAGVISGGGGRPRMARAR